VATFGAFAKTIELLRVDEHRMKISIPGFIHAQRVQDREFLEMANIVGKHRFSFFLGDDVRYMNYTPVCPYTLNFEIPDNWNPVTDEIAILEKARDQLQKEYKRKNTEITNKIAKYLSIEYEELKP